MKKTSNKFHQGALNIIFFVHFSRFSINTLKTLGHFSKIFSPCSLPSIYNKVFVPSFEQTIQGLFRTHFPFFKDSIQCKKELWVYSFFSSSTTWVILSRRSFCVCSFFFRVQLNYKISTEIQGPSVTDCNFQGLSWPWIFILKFKAFQDVCKPW